MPLLIEIIYIRLSGSKMASSGYYNCRVTVELGHVQTFQCIAAERSRVRGEQKAKRGNGEFHMRKGLNEELKEDWI